MRAPFQGSQIMAVEAAQPAIKRLAADAEMPASACSVPPIEEIKKHPLKSRSRPAAQTLSEARQLARLGKLIPSDLAHPDTLQSVTNHSERAHSPEMIAHFRGMTASRWQATESGLAYQSDEKSRRAAVSLHF